MTKTPKLPSPYTTHYIKEGRKYIPVSVHWEQQDYLPVGTFWLCYAYAKGGGMYQYDVTPDTAGFVAASMIAEKVIEEEIAKARQYEPSGTKKYNKKQLEILAEFIEKIEAAGAMMPPMWTLQTSHEIARKAVDAVRNFKP